MQRRRARAGSVHRVQVARPARKDSVIIWTTKSADAIRAQYGDRLLNLDLYVFSQSLSKKG